MTFSIPFIVLLMSCIVRRISSSTSSSLFTCYPTCLTCTGPNIEQCSTCSSNLLSINKTCACADGFYYAGGLVSCQVCNSHCRTCNGGTDSNCLTCVNGYQLYQGSCYPSCISGQYFNTSTLSCKPCNSRCQTCSGPSADECTSCLGSNPMNGTCKCPTGYYVVDSGGCLSCSTTCKECAGPSATQCTTCKPGMIFQKGQCICPTGNLQNINPLSCASCSEACLGCSGSGSNVCTSCKNNLVLTSSLQCVCPSSTYYHSQTYSCLACSSLCEECLDSGANQCTSCRNNLVLLNQQCVCPSATYLNTTTAICIACDPTCKECTGPSSTQCSSCSSQYSLVSGQCTCTTGSCQCSLDQYYDNAASVCQDCSSVCAECSGPSSSSCTACATGFSLSNGQCVCQQSICSCPAGTYFQTSSGICMECSSSCEECSGSQSDQCTSCTNNLALSTSSVGSCICPTGTYLDQLSQICLDCSATCMTCSGPSSTQCLGCQSDATLFSSGSCVCSTNFYFDAGAAKCQGCASTCQTCSGPERSQCLSCSSATATLQNGYCIPICLQSEYRASDMSCQPCDKSCQTCSGSDANQCTSCASPLTLSSNTCSEVSSNGCFYKCSACMSSSKYECTQCNAGLYLIKATTTSSYGYCSASCPVGYYYATQNSQQVCRPKTMLTNQFAYSNTTDQIQITFDHKITPFLSELVQSIDVSLDLRSDQTALAFSYSLDLMSNSQSLLLTLTYSGNLLPGNVLKISYSLPLATATDTDHSSMIYVLYPVQSIRLMEYYDTSTSKTSGSSAVSKFASAGSIINQLFSWTSTIIFRGMHAIRSEIIEDMIGYIIFMNVDFALNFSEFAKDGLNSFEIIFPNVFEHLFTYMEKEAAKNNEEESRVLQSFSVHDKTHNSVPLEDNEIKQRHRTPTYRSLVSQTSQTVINKNISSRYFLLNHGSATAFIFVVITIALIIEISQYFLNRIGRFKKLRDMMQKASFTTRWNLLIGHFSSEFQGFVFFPLLELSSTFYGKKSLHSLDLFFTVIFLCISILSMISFFVLPFIIHKKMKLLENETNPTKKTELHSFLKRFEILFDVFRQDRVIPLLYTGFLHLRSFGFAVMLIAANASPYAQISYLIVSTVAIIFYLCYIRPFKSKSQHTLTLVYELIFLSIAVATLALHAHNQKATPEANVKALISLVILVLAMVLFVVNCINFTLETVEFIRGRPKDKKVIPSDTYSNIKPYSLSIINSLSKIEAQKASNDFLLSPRPKSSLTARESKRAKFTRGEALLEQTHSRFLMTGRDEKEEISREPNRNLKSLFLQYGIVRNEFVWSDGGKMSYQSLKPFKRQNYDLSSHRSTFQRSLVGSQQSSIVIENKEPKEEIVNHPLEDNKKESDFEKHGEDSDRGSEGQKMKESTLSLLEVEKSPPQKSRFLQLDKLKFEASVLKGRQLDVKLSKLRLEASTRRRFERNASQKQLHSGFNSQRGDLARHSYRESRTYFSVERNRETRRGKEVENDNERTE